MCPLYAFTCPHCHNEFDQLCFTVGTTHNVDCPVCNSHVIRCTVNIASGVAVKWKDPPDTASQGKETAK
jgi:predicted nucleic acid-binding Zn ribbon protein